MKAHEVSSKPAATFFEAVERAEAPRVQQSSLSKFSETLGLSPRVRQAVKTLSAVRCFSIVLPLLPASR
jgi:hypothetical protein